ARRKPGQEPGPRAIGSALGSESPLAPRIKCGAWRGNGLPIHSCIEDAQKCAREESMSDATANAPANKLAAPGLSDGHVRYALYLLLGIYTLNFVDRQIVAVLGED